MPNKKKTPPLGGRAVAINGYSIHENYWKDGFKEVLVDGKESDLSFDEAKLWAKSSAANNEPFDKNIPIFKCDIHICWMPTFEESFVLSDEELKIKSRVYDEAVREWVWDNQESHGISAPMMTCPYELLPKESIAVVGGVRISGRDIDPYIGVGYIEKFLSKAHNAGLQGQR